MVSIDFIINFDSVSPTTREYMACYRISLSYVVPAQLRLLLGGPCKTRSARLTILSEPDMLDFQRRADEEKEPGVQLSIWVCLKTGYPEDHQMNITFGIGWVLGIWFCDKPSRYVLEIDIASRQCSLSPAAVFLPTYFTIQWGQLYFFQNTYMNPKTIDSPAKKLE